MPIKDLARKREFQRAWCAARRAAYFADKACSRCGSKNDLELHHVFQDTKVSHRIWSWAAWRREQELAKCVVLCSSCHDLETRAQRARPLRHGTVRGYRRGCRCERCRCARMGVAGFEPATPAV